MAKANTNEIPRLYSLAAGWSGQANDLDLQADELMIGRFVSLAGVLRGTAEQLRNAARSARTMAAQAE